MKISEIINDEKITFEQTAHQVNGNNAITYIEFESYQNRPTLNEFIQEYFNRSCSCSHDCCGHIFTCSIDLLSIFKDQWLIRIVSAKNY